MCPNIRKFTVSQKTLTPKIRSHSGCGTWSVFGFLPMMHFTEKNDCRRTPKKSDAPKKCCYRPKILTRWIYDGIMSPNDADGMANGVDLIRLQAAPLIWVCTVCPDLSVRKLRIITVDI